LPTHAIINKSNQKIKNMTISNRKFSPSLLFRLRGERLLALLFLVALLVASPFVYADTLQQQINNLNNQNNQKQSTVNSLQLQASSYQDAISKLQQQIDAIEGAIQASQDQQAKLQQEIIADQQQIDQKKQQLSATLKAMYIDGQTTTIEELASSKNLSDYVDKEEYRTAVQNQLNTIIQQVSALEQQQQAQKIQVDQLLATQQQQQAKLGSDQQQKTNLLGYNQGQQDQYNQQIQSNNKQISALQAEQARINAASSRTVSGIGPSGGSGGYCDIGMGNGGYPLAWCNAGLDEVTTSGGFPSRECTSFAFWYFTSMEGKSLSVSGNAKDWVYTSSRPVTQTPHVGDIFVNTAGNYGHTGIVASIDGGWVRTISMNDDWQGHFYNNREYPINSLYYIN
jgi:peptidoglycan hydrolase CwlO-like protein